jgi:hypothetical protein
MEQTRLLRHPLSDVIRVCDLSAVQLKLMRVHSTLLWDIHQTSFLLVAGCHPTDG